MKFGQDVGEACGDAGVSFVWGEGSQWFSHFGLSKIFLWGGALWLGTDGLWLGAVRTRFRRTN